MPRMPEAPFAAPRLIKISTPAMMSQGASVKNRSFSVNPPPSASAVTVTPCARSAGSSALSPGAGGWRVANVFAGSATAPGGKRIDRLNVPVSASP